MIVTIARLASEWTKGRVMRLSIICGVGLISMVGSAAAADLPILRGSSGYEMGSPSYYNWSGVYVGGQGSYSAAGSDFSKGTSDLVGYILRNTTLENEAHVSNWTTLPRAGATASGYGGFVGYNAQMEDVVVGIELNYTRTKLGASGTDSIGRSYQTSDGYFYDVDVSGTASIQLKDAASLRVRTGWGAPGYMPYGFVGVAAGRADVARSATVATTAIDVSGAVPPRPNLALGPITNADNRYNAFSFGYVAGAGIEYAVIPNLFLRAEYEFMRFGSFYGINMSINTVRAAVGARF
jgi:outer membrane immunogenic protein